MDFGKKLRELRMSAGLTQAQLGDMIGVTKSVISFYELQERSPSPDVLVKLSQVFHVSTDYLLGLSAKETIDITGLDKDDIAIIRTMAERLRRDGR
ncbi:MAG: helix-turn-helix transcriptional regulator [Clostridia bacterium]|nr:helix-turn-helix transcriptional regulator [Clostridia bacterium]